MNDETFRINPVREKRQHSDDAKDVDVNDEYDANDVDDENDFFQMPSLILSGPYHYDVCDTHISFHFSTTWAEPGNQS